MTHICKRYCDFRGKQQRKSADCFVIARDYERFRAISPRPGGIAAGTRFAICNLALGVPSSTRRTLVDVLAFAGGLVILMFAISASDDRVRRDVWSLFTTDRGPGAIVGLGDQLSRIGGAGMDVLSQWSHLHPYLVAFALVAGVVLVAVRRL
jgi:hypothetical protein